MNRFWIEVVYKSVVGGKQPAEHPSHQDNTVFQDDTSKIGQGMSRQATKSIAGFFRVTSCSQSRFLCKASHIQSIDAQHLR